MHIEIFLKTSFTCANSIVGSSSSETRNKPGMDDDDLSTFTTMIVITTEMNQPWKPSASCNWPFSTGVNLSLCIVIKRPPLKCICSVTDVSWLSLSDFLLYWGNVLNEINVIYKRQCNFEFLCWSLCHHYCHQLESLQKLLSLIDMASIINCR